MSKKYNELTNAERFIANQQKIAEAGSYGFELAEFMKDDPDMPIYQVVDDLIEYETSHKWSWKDLADIVRDHYERCSEEFSNAMICGDYLHFSDFLTTCLGLDIEDELLKVRLNVVKLLAGHELFSLYVADDETVEDIPAEVCNALEECIASVDDTYSLNNIKAMVFGFYVKNKIKEG